MPAFPLRPILLGLAPLACLSLAPEASENTGLQIVGPSVLLNAQIEEKPLVYDLRKTGRAVPNAISAPKKPRERCFVLGEIETATRWAQLHQIQNAQIIAPRLIEFHHEVGVPQIAPLRAQKSELPIFDISEQFEFDGFRIPNSKRLDYADFRRGNHAILPKNTPFLVACRVGHRSQLVTQKLRKLGFDARNLDGGLWAWEVAGLPLARGK